MGRRRKSEPIIVLTEEQKRDRINHGFEEIRSLMLRVGVLKAEHITPLTKAITKEWRSLKAETGTDQADLKPFFQLYMRDRLAEEADDEADAERIRANLKRVYQALALGETLDWLTALGSSDDEPADDDGQIDAGGDLDPADDDEAAEAAMVEEGETAESASADERQEGVAGPDTDWGDDHLDPKEGEDGSTAGFAYRAGESAAENGTEFRTLLRNYGKHHASAWAKSARAGFAAMTKRLERAKQAETGEGIEVAPLNVVAIDRTPIPLPAVDDAAVSPGDAA